MGNFQLPRPTALDTIGVTIPGAKLYFYLAGTSTPFTIYADAANTVPLTNPVIADANGRFPNIYIPTTTHYKIVFNTPTDVLVYTEDNLDSFALNNSSVEKRLRQVASNPLDYGAVGDGVANEVVAVQAAIDASVGTIDLLGKTYRCDTGLTMPQGRRLLNGVLDFSLCPDAACLALAPGSLGTAVLLTVDATAGSTALVAASTASLAAGAWVLLRKALPWATGTQGCSELVRVRTVVDVNNFTVDSPLRLGYAVVDSASIAAITPTSRFHISDLKIIGVSAIDQKGIYANFSTDVHIDSVVVQGIDGPGVALSSCINSSVSRSSFRDATFSLTGSGVAVLESCSGVLVDSCWFNDTQYGVVVGGVAYITHDVLIRNSSFAGCRVVAVNLSRTSNNCSVQNCIVTGAQDSNCDGIYVSGKGNEVVTTTIRSVKRYGVHGEPAGPTSAIVGGVPVGGIENVWLNITDNNVTLCGVTGILISSINGMFSGLKVNDNHVGDCGSGGVNVYVPVGTAFNAVSVSNNLFDWRTSGGSAILFSLDDLSGATVAHLSVSNNTIENASVIANAIYLTSAGAYFENAIVCGNIVNGGLSGIAVENPNIFSLSGNTLSSRITVSLLTATSYRDISICGNTVSASTSSAISVSAAAATLTELIIDKNQVNSSVNSSILLTGTTGVIRNATISANTLNSPTQSGISVLAGNAGGTIENLVISNNTVYNALTNGIRLSREDSLAIFRTVTICGNIINVCGNRGIYLTDIGSVVVSSNIIRQVVNEGIFSEMLFVASLRGLAVSSNVLNGTGISVNSNLSGIYEDICISCNVISDAVSNSIEVHALNTSTLSAVCISGNQISRSNGIGVNLSSNGTIADFSVTGNHLVIATNAVDGVLFQGSGLINKGIASSNYVTGGRFSFNRTVTSLSNVVIGGNISSLSSSGTAPGGVPSGTGIGFPIFTDPGVIGGTAPGSYMTAYNTSSMPYAVTEAWPNFKT